MSTMILLVVMGVLARVERVRLGPLVIEFYGTKAAPVPLLGGGDPQA